MARKRQHEHRLIRLDESGDYYLDLLCPECEAAGVTMNDEELREALLRVEEAFQREGIKLTDLVEGEGLAEIERILGRTVS